MKRAEKKERETYCLFASLRAVVTDCDVSKTDCFKLQDIVHNAVAPFLKI
jgi:hypothetical protein